MAHYWNISKMSILNPVKQGLLYVTRKVGKISRLLSAYMYSYIFSDICLIAVYPFNVKPASDSLIDDILTLQSAVYCVGYWILLILSLAVSILNVLEFAYNILISCGLPMIVYKIDMLRATDLTVG